MVQSYVKPKRFSPPSWRRPAFYDDDFFSVMDALEGNKDVIHFNHTSEGSKNNERMVYGKPDAPSVNDKRKLILSLLEGAPIPFIDVTSISRGHHQLKRYVADGCHIGTSTIYGVDRNSVHFKKLLDKYKSITRNYWIGTQTQYFLKEVLIHRKNTQINLSVDNLVRNIPIPWL